MGYIDLRKARLKAQLAQIQAALTSLYTQLGEQAVSSVQSYQFDSGDGSQRTTRRKLSEIQDQIERLEATEDHLINELYNMGLTSVQVRRKNPYC
jgi:predicted negative regulator of RcsB-dependent stress response